MKPKLVTFDAGNTLIYAYPSLGGVYAEVTRRFGVAVEPELFAETMVPIYRELTRSARWTGSDEGDRELWRRITRGIYERIDGLRGIEFEPWFEGLWTTFGSSAAWRPFDDTLPALHALHSRGVRVGIISNWDTRLRRILEELGLLELMAVVQISSEAGARKPEPLMFRAAERQLRVRSEEALHVGDTLEEDVRGARAAGWGAALLDRSGRHQPGPDAGYVTIASLLEIPAQL
jgi:putative hydrolase of the HAD superfamily